MQIEVTRSLGQLRRDSLFSIPILFSHLQAVCEAPREREKRKNRRQKKKKNFASSLSIYVEFIPLLLSLSLSVSLSFSSQRRVHSVYLLILPASLTFIELKINFLNR